MIRLGIELVDDRLATLRFEQFPQFAHARLLVALNNIEQRLEGAVRVAQPVRSGKLQSQTGGRVYDHGNRIAAVVGVRAPDANDARKAAALEYGSSKALMIRAHSMKLTHLWGRAISPITIRTNPHQRIPNLPALRFLRGPLEAMRSTALAEMQAAVEAAVQDADR